MILLSLPHPHRGVTGGGGDNIQMRMVVKENVGAFDEEVREGFARRLTKDLNAVVQVISMKKMFLVRFRGGC